MAGMACPVCRTALAARYDRRFRGGIADVQFHPERPMPALRAEPVQLTASERTALKERARGHKTAHRDRQRALIVLPAATGVPLARWSCPELAAELASRGLVSAISPSSVRRILAEHPIKPWQYQSWIFPRDPDFAARAAVVLDLYQGFYQGRPLEPGDRIVSVDAKPSIQARARRHRPAPPAPGQPMRVEHEYQRKGALALLAALDVRTGTVSASTPKTTGIAPFMALMGQIMSQEPYRSAPRVFVIVDNGSDHRGKKAARRLRHAYPNCIMIHTPVHASWLNQIEIFFSIVQKKVVSPNDFTSTSQLSATLLAFINRHNQTARPFNWKFTAKDLAGLLERISAHQEPAGRPHAGGRTAAPSPRPWRARRYTRARRKQHDQVVPSGGNGLTANHEHRSCRRSSRPAHRHLASGLRGAERSAGNFWVRWRPLHRLASKRGLAACGLLNAGRPCQLGVRARGLPTNTPVGGVPTRQRRTLAQCGIGRRDPRRECAALHIRVCTSPISRVQDDMAAKDPGACTEGSAATRRKIAQEERHAREQVPQFR